MKKEGVKMTSVDIKTRIGKIRFEGDKSCIFIIETEEGSELQED